MVRPMLLAVAGSLALAAPAGAQAGAAPLAPAWPLVQVGLVTADNLLGTVARLVDAGGPLLVPPATGEVAPDPTASVTDTLAPTLTFRLRSSLREAARTGTIVVDLTSSEPALVDFAARVRAVKARRVDGRRLKLARTVSATEPARLSFRLPGTASVSLTLPERGRQELRRARTARVSLHASGADLASNAFEQSVKRTLRR